MTSMNFLSDTILPEKLSLFLYKCKRTFLEQNDTYEKHFSFSMFPFPVALVTCNGPGRWAILQTPVKGSRGRARGGHNMPRRGAPAERTGRGLETQALTPLSPQRRVEEERRAPPVSPCWGPGRCRDRRAEVNRRAPSLPDADLRIGVSSQEMAPRGGVVEGGQGCPGPSGWPGWSPAVGRAPAHLLLVRRQH